MKVQDLVIKMLFATRTGVTDNGAKADNMVNLYVAFERNINEIADRTGNPNGVVFAGLLDAVAEMGKTLLGALQQAVDNAPEKTPEPVAAPQAEVGRKRRRRRTPEEMAAARAAEAKNAKGTRRKPGVGRKVTRKARSY